MAICINLNSATRSNISIRSVNVVGAPVIFKAHKDTLANKSKYFRALLMFDPDVEIALFPTEDLPAEHAETFLRLLYGHDNAVITKDNAANLLEIADYFCSDDVVVFCQGRDAPIFLQFFYLFSIFFLNCF
jgi:hypothetical protein